MRIIFITLATICIMTISSFAQMTFLKHYGGFTGRGNSLILNSNGNYIIAGRKNLLSNYDQFSNWEINTYGDTLWLKHYGTNSFEQANQIIQTIDGGYATVGFSKNYNSNYRTIYLVKTNSTGNLTWTKQIGGLGQENGTSIVQSNTGEYFIGGTSTNHIDTLYDFFLLKTDINGDTLWSKRYGGSQNEESNSMRQTTDNGFILCGYSESFSYGLKDFYLVKTNGSGDTLWTKHCGGLLDEIAYSVRQTSDGGYIMTGYSQSYGISNWNMYVVKTNSVGDTMWTKTFGHIGRYSQGNDIIQTTEGGYIVTGLIKTASSNGGYDFYLVKIDPSGNIEWEKELKIEPSNTSSTSSEGKSILQTPDGGYAIAGGYFNAQTIELLLIKTDNTGAVGLIEQEVNSNFNVFPNPFSNKTTLQFDNIKKENSSLTIYNMQGQVMRTINNITKDKVEIERQNLLTGLYYFQLRTDRHLIATGKLIIE